MTNFSKKTYHFSIFLSLIALSLVYYKTFLSADNLLLESVRGKILLQIEDKGQAWYVNPETSERIYLKKPIDAFYTMKTLGTGITKENLSKIPLAEANLEGKDKDKDGLSDDIETALGTDPEKADTDEDGYTDKEEILNNYNPLGSGKIDIDEDYAQKRAGKIFLQIEQNGEGWYINPGDNKRYFLGSPTDAFQVMRQTGLGISNQDLSQIPKYEFITEKNNDAEENNSETNDQYGDLKKYSQKEFNFYYDRDWKILRDEPNYNMVMLGNYDRDPFLEKKGVITIYLLETDRVQKAENLTTEEKTYYDLIEKETLNINNLRVIKETLKYTKLEDNYETNLIIKIEKNKFFKLSIMSPSEDKYNEIWQTILETLKVK